MATIDTIAANDGVKLAFCLLIEGYSKAIVNDSSYDWATAYTATDWSASGNFITGLNVPESSTERIELFAATFSGAAMSFVVSPDDDDTLGIAAHATAKAAGTETLLAAELTNDPTDTITVKSTAGFASSGDIHIGTETIGYTSTTGTTFAGTVTRGKYAPYKDTLAANQRHPQSHKLTDYGVAKLLPRVTDYIRIWAGRRVRLMVHVVTGTALDAFSNAYTAFSGVIESIRDGGQNTVIDCKSMVDVIGDSILFADQFEAVVKEGIYLAPGPFVSVEEQSVSGGTSTRKDPNELTIVASGATAGVSINAGFYTAEEICSEISDWLAAETAAGRLVGTWRARIGRVDGTGRRVALSGIMPSSTDGRLIFVLRSYAAHLGLPDGGITTRWGETESETATAFPYPPARVVPLQQAGQPQPQILVASTQGTWLATGASWLPDPWDALPESSTTWGYVLIGSVLALVRWDGSDTFGVVIGTNGPLYNQFAGTSAPDRGYVPVPALTLDDPGDLVIKQVAVVQGTLADIMLRILHSSDDGARTAATYDDADFAAIALGMPGELFSTGTVPDLNFIQGLADPTITVMLEKPTTFREVFESDLILRGAYPVMNDGKLRFAGPTVAPGARAQHTLTTSNKATPADAQDSDRSRSYITSELIRNRITVQYGRTLEDGGSYIGSRSIVNAASISDMNESRAITIRARNTYGEDADLAPRIQDLLAHLGSFALGLFGYPVTIVTRTISRKLFGMMPGDLVALTDDAARNPLTGQRGVVGYPGWVLSVSRDWSTGLGQVELVLTSIDDGDRYAPYSPAAEIDSGNASNYNSNQTTFTTIANRFSLATDSPSTDAASFEAGDEIYFIEASPANVAGASVISATIDTVGTNTITITGGGVTLNASTLYYVISQEWTNATTTQRGDSYHAASATALINSSAISRLWSSALIFNLGTPAAVDTTVRHKYPADDWADDGYAVSTAAHTMAANTATNLINHRCAPQFPVIQDASKDDGGGNYYFRGVTPGTSYQLDALFPVYLGIGTMSDSTNWTRQINVQPLLQANSGGSTMSARITISREPPIGSDFNNLEFVEPYEQVEFTTTSTTAAYPTAGQLRRIAGRNGVAWVSIEIKNTSGDGYMYGIPQMWLGGMA